MQKSRILFVLIVFIAFFAVAAKFAHDSRHAADKAALTAFLGDSAAKPAENADALYPRGRRMLFAGYSGKPERDLSAGFTVAGPFYGADNVAQVDACIKAGRPVIVQVGALNKNGTDSIDTVSKLPEAEIRRRVSEQVARCAGSDAVVMWAVEPEELRPWKKAEMEYLRVVADAVRAADPKGRPVFLYNPNHRDAKSLEQIAAQVDVVGKGCYVNAAGFKDDRAWVRWSVEQLVAAAEKAGRGGVPIVMPELAKSPAAEDVLKIPAWVRHDVYLGLMSGAKGVLLWSLFPRKEVKDTWQAWYDAYSGCAKELNGERGLSRIFLFGEKRDDLRVEPVEPRAPKPLGASAKNSLEAATTSASEGKGGLLHPWTKAEYAHGGARHLFLANSCGEPTTFRVTGFPSKGVRLVSAMTGAAMELPSANRPLEVRLAPWEVTALSFVAE